VAIVVFDITSGWSPSLSFSHDTYTLLDRQSFLSTTKWIEDVRSERGNDVMVVLVGNKADLSDKRCALIKTSLGESVLRCRRQVTLEEATAKSQELGIMFMETSAKAGHNVKSLFKKIAMSLPGMEKDNQNADAQNTSASTFEIGHLLSRL
jgi:Ras-related protein Rab-6A